MALEGEDSASAQYSPYTLKVAWLRRRQRTSGLCPDSFNKSPHGGAPCAPASHIRGIRGSVMPPV
ncbi:hypothetical protein HPB47_001042 [Ixodes persulcatus]|uniref:Uncharacterized protein n=1 Tax=Ixodes persulcatus TaxID=34615 RepID=A0AC60PQ46_IXOPE|nr:hypothetical protein HPB47_001042 [Ixodes persulcatus]